MEKKLTRDPQDKMMGGVAAGLAKYFGLDTTWVRIAFALAAVFGGTGLWIYIILWIAVPEDRQSSFTYTDYRMNQDEPLKPVNDFKKSNNTSLFIGFVLIVMGAYFLLGEFDLLPYWFSIRKLWPLTFVVFGLLILSKARTNKAPLEKPEDKSKAESEFKSPTDDYNKS